MGVVEQDAAMEGAQPRDLGGQRPVIGLEERPLAPRDLARIGRGAPIERVAVEGRRGAQFGRRLPRIERGARRVAVHVDDAARDAGRHRRRAEIADESIKLRSEEHTSELQSLMSNSYAVYCLKK